MTYIATKQLNEDEILKLHKEGKIEEIILSSLRIVYALLNQHSIIYNKECFISAGVEALVIAANTWNPKNGIPWCPYAYYKIKEAIIAEYPYANGSVLSYTSGTRSSTVSRRAINTIKIIRDHKNDTNGRFNDNVYNSIIASLPDKTDTLEKIIHEEDILEAKRIVKLLRDNFEDVEVDSLLQYKEFSIKYPTINAKCHDNMKQRSIRKFTRFLNGGSTRTYGKRLTDEAIKDLPPIKYQDPPKTKVCYLCHKRKPINLYNRTKTNLSGYLNYCRSCSKLKRSKYRESSSGLRRREIWKENNRFNIKEYRDNYRRNHPNK